MNKHGQTLILFVILIPILLLFAALIIDTGIVISKKVHMLEITKEGIKEVLNNNLDILSIKELLIENKIDTTKLEINTYDKRIEVKNEIEADSFFASMIGIKTYQIKIDVIGYRDNNKIIFE